MTGLAAWIAAALSACGGSSSGGGQSGIPGNVEQKPGGGFFIVDPNQSGGGSRLHLVQVSWGRLVDVHEVDANGDMVTSPVYADFLIEEDVQTTTPNPLNPGSARDYFLGRDPITQRERLIVGAQNDPNVMDDAFDELVGEASDNLPTVAPKNDDGSSAPPFTEVPRNACVSLRFDDCLLNTNDVALILGDLVKVDTGYPPLTPYTARVIFDENHGANAGGSYRPTRVLVDMTILVSEAGSLPPNAVGLPGSVGTSSSPNVSIVIPSRVDIGSSQNRVLTNVSGVSLDKDDNGPVDLNSPTEDIIRAFRSGHSTAPSEFNGFLKDQIPPRLIGSWAVNVTQALEDLTGDAGFDFLLDATFTTSCLNDPQVGDVIRIGDEFLVVTEPASLMGGNTVTGLKVHSFLPVGDPADLEDPGFFEAAFDASSTLEAGCWVTFVPAATTFPSTGVSTSAQIFARFSEPMDPETVTAFDNFLVVEGNSATVATPSNIVVGAVLPNDDLNQFAFNPVFPFPHESGDPTPMHVELTHVRDLAGNLLLQADSVPFVDFTIDPVLATQRNGAVVLRFDDNDEVGPNDGKLDLRGQFFYNHPGGIDPRPVTFAGWPIDRTAPPVPANMTALTGGIFTPLTPLGARVQTVWRYCDVGWNVRDETKYNMDIIGLNWAPVGGLVVRDFFEQFEIRLGHSRFLPDEGLLGTGAACCAASGLPGNPAPFEDNFLPGSDKKVVHNRGLGYTVNPPNLFLATTNTSMMPYPLNTGPGDAATYTWRDTSVLTKGGNGPAAPGGIPLKIEENLLIEPAASAGTLAARGQVPSFGLPLLMEFRCYPSNRGIGMNRFDVSMAIAAFNQPNFRAYSAGGINTAGLRTLVLPDSADTPSGGFNPLSTPPGKATLTDSDNLSYLGQLDTVVRVSVVHTVWLDAGLGILPIWQAQVTLPTRDDQPLGTEVLLEFRGATGFAGTSGAEFDATKLNAYGELTMGTANFLGSGSWSSDISTANGGEFIQVRITFKNNIETGLSPKLDALALPFLGS